MKTPTHNYSFEKFCEAHSDQSIKITMSELEQLKNLVQVLEHAFTATQKLQSSQHYKGDF